MILSHHCYCSVMPGQSYCFTWDNGAINLKRSLPLHFNFFFFLHAPKTSSMQIHHLHKGLDPCLAQNVDILHYQQQHRLHRGAVKDEPQTQFSMVFENCCSFTCAISHVQKNRFKNKTKKPAADSTRKHRVSGRSPYHPNKYRLCCQAAPLFHAVSLSCLLLESKCLPGSVT